MRKLVIGLLIIACGIAAGWYVAKSSTGLKRPSVSVSQTPTPRAATPLPGIYDVTEVPVSGIPSQTNTTKGGIPQNPTGKPAVSATVSYTDTGFKEPVVTVKLGTTVTFTNASQTAMWIASSPHPSHSAYPEFDQKKSVGRGGTYAFTFTKVGTWKYHNHVLPDQTGVVIVTQ